MNSASTLDNQIRSCGYGSRSGSTLGDERLTKLKGKEGKKEIIDQYIQGSHEAGLAQNYENKNKRGQR
jgi:hypothetical protein